MYEYVSKVKSLNSMNNKILSDWTENLHNIIWITQQGHTNLALNGLHMWLRMSLFWPAAVVSLHRSGWLERMCPSCVVITTSSVPEVKILCLVKATGVDWLLNATFNYISVIHVMAQRCGGVGSHASEQWNTGRTPNPKPCRRRPTCLHP